MTKQEVGKLLSVAEGAYPEKTAFWNDATQRNLANAWTLALEDYTYEQGSTALRVYLKSDKYNRLPGPGQIANIIEELKAQSNPEKSMTPAEAWAIVRPAIRDSYYHGVQHFEEFPDIVKEAVGNPDRLKEWGQMGSETVDSVVQSNFCNKIFPTIIKRHEYHDRLPVDVAKMIETKREEYALTKQHKLTAIESARSEKMIAAGSDVPTHSSHYEEIMRHREMRKRRKAQ